MKGNRILSTAMAALTLLTAPAALPQQALLPVAVLRKRCLERADMGRFQVGDSEYPC